MVTTLIRIDDVNRFVAALMNGSKTRYSSSSLLKNAQTWRAVSSWEPAKEIGGATFLILRSSIGSLYYKCGQSGGSKR